jgi:hypothetical protein
MIGCFHNKMFAEFNQCAPVQRRKDVQAAVRSVAELRVQRLKVDAAATHVTDVPRLKTLPQQREQTFANISVLKTLRLSAFDRIYRYRCNMNRSTQCLPGVDWTGLHHCTPAERNC